MSGFIKYFENNTKKTMSFLADDDDVILKYNKIWIQKLLSNEFDSQPVYDEKHIQTRVKTFGDKITKFTDNEIPKKN